MLEDKIKKLGERKQEVFRQLENKLFGEIDEKYAKAGIKVLYNHRRKEIESLAHTIGWIAGECNNREIAAAYRFLNKYPKQNKCIESIIANSGMHSTERVIAGVHKLFDKRGSDVFDGVLPQIAESTDWSALKPAIKLFYKYPETKEVAEYLEVCDLRGCRVGGFLEIFDEKTLNILKRYDLRNSIYEFIFDQYLEKKTKKSLVTAIHKVLGDEEAVEVINKENGAMECLMTLCLETLGNIPNKDALRLFKNYSGRYVKRIADTFVDIMNQHSGLEVGAYAKVLNKYNYSKYIMDAVESMTGWLEEHHYLELIKDKAYKEISISGNPKKAIETILARDYASIQKEISVELSYRDLDLVKGVLDFIKEVHKERSDKAHKKIYDGFYRELNRAISQSKSYDKQVQNVRTYCREVQIKMKENIEDLMVITNV